MSGERQSVVLIVIDALRYDCIPSVPSSPYLYAARLTLPPLPTLAQLAGGAYRFDQAIACAPYTPAAFASLFTGLLPPQHGVRAHAATSLHPDVRTLATVLAEAGYRTCAMTDYPEVLAPVGLLKDFSLTVKDEEAALAWWRAYPAEPRFLLLHLWDVHKPYNMPLGPVQGGLYAQRVAQWRARLSEHGVPVPADLDDQSHPEPERHRVNVMQCLWEKRFGWAAGLNEYLDGLQTFDSGRLHALVDACRSQGVLDDALVVVTSDHGEGRCAQGYGALNHAQNLLDDTIRIPLLLRVPGSAGGRIADQVSQADIVPTLLDLLTLPDPRSPADVGSGGRSLAPLLRGRRLPPRPAYAELSLARPARAAAEPLPDDPPSVVRYRVLRTPTRKACLTGQHARADGAWLSAPADVFVRNLYRDVLGRFESAGDLAWWLDKLRDEGSTPDLQRRRTMVHDVERSPEGAGSPKYAIYDLQRDPLEEHPRTPASGPLFWAEYRRYLHVMQDIERQARTGAPLLAPEGDDEIIRQRLQALGYVE